MPADTMTKTSDSTFLPCMSFVRPITRAPPPQVAPAYAGFRYLSLIMKPPCPRNPYARSAVPQKHAHKPSATGKGKAPTRKRVRAHGNGKGISRGDLLWHGPRASQAARTKSSKNEHRKGGEDLVWPRAELTERHHTCEKAPRCQTEAQTRQRRCAALPLPAALARLSSQDALLTGRLCARPPESRPSHRHRSRQSKQPSPSPGHPVPRQPEATKRAAL